MDKRSYKKVICVLLMVGMVIILSAFIYNKIEEKFAQNYVVEFLKLSYNCGTENVEEVLKEQSRYYEETMRQICEKNPPIDVEYVKKTEQEMCLVSDVVTSVEKNAVGNRVVHAEFIVQFKDIYEQEGFTEILQLNVTLVRDGFLGYLISDIS